MSSHLRWASTLIRSLYKSGVRHAVISPGSRSTPLTIAAAIHDGLQKHVAVDERSAAFIALGIGKSTGKPAVLICTSGTAAANYLPAIVEAKESGVPMIVLTADRPPNLRGIGSSQTVDQIKLYGEQAVFFHEAGEPGFEPADLRRLEYLGKQAVEAALETGGAAHINLPFRKPLEPEDSEVDEEMKRNRAEAGPFHPAVSGRTITLSDTVHSLIRSAKRPLVIAGPSDPARSLQYVFEKAVSTLNAPAIAEPGSGLRVDDHHTILRYEQFLRNESVLQELTPDLILRFGDQPFTKSLLTALEKWDDIPLIHFSARRAVQDHALSVDYFIHCGIDDSIQFHSEVKDSGWLGKWREYDKKAASKLNELLAGTGQFTDGHVFSALSGKVPATWSVMLSNSLIPRDMALFGLPTPSQFVNRGAAGIDGISSTAIGVQKGSGRPVLSFTGDIAFLHDSNALLSLRELTQPFVIMVVNNGGGTIFRMLPVYRTKELYTPYFETPQTVDLKPLAEAHGVSYLRITGREQLNGLNFSSLSGAVLIECVTDPDAGMNLRKSLWDFTAST